MSSLARKLLIYAAAEALIIHPIDGPQDSRKTVCIEYGSNRISTRQSFDYEHNTRPIIESHGIIGRSRRQIQRLDTLLIVWKGVLNLVSSSYLISITKREEVAKVHGTPIYAIRDVTLIPLSSQESAIRTISAAQRKLDRPSALHSDQSEASDVGDDADTSSVDDDDDDHSKVTGHDLSNHQMNDNYTSDASRQNKNPFGRFGQRWFDGRKRQQSAPWRPKIKSNEDEFSDVGELQPWGEIQREDNDESVKNLQNISAQRGQQQSTGKTPVSAKSVIDSLTPRILRSMRLYFNSGGFYFSYTLDISRPFGSRQEDSVVARPLSKNFKVSYFWNKHLITPFIDADCDEIAIPIMQGFVGQRSFSISKPADTGREIIGQQRKEQPEPESEKSKSSASVTNLLLTLVSHRSTKRAGLRYLRREVDEGGNVANLVETEQILSMDSSNSDHKTFSLLQVRGSIPLFFSQSPYSFKPLPMMFGSESANQDAFQKHFTYLGDCYGDVQVASLVDKHGTEVAIGEAYERHMQQMNEQVNTTYPKVGFEWFDFHSVCKGMKFENVSLLLDSLEAKLNSFGWNTFLNDQLVQRQTGVLRTNCMDCLDRTNVVQSAVGGWALQQQLSGLGLEIDLRNDVNTQWFNTLWADNGDAISKQYAGTAALKGDFTRTRKRNWAGALSDFSLTLTRYYNNIFGDYFLQTEIDYLLGNAGPEIFDEFETDMMSKDYALDMRRIRHHAIDTCMKIVLEHPEEQFISGWTLSCPSEPNTVRSSRFEDCILLITKSALYFCRFDWTTEKVNSFERIDLLDIKQVWRGAYITSTLGPTHLDETKNVGFVLRYTVAPQAIIRTNTRSLQNEKIATDENHGKDELEKQKAPEKDGSRLLAFKALSPKASAARRGHEELPDMVEKDIVDGICRDLHHALDSTPRGEEEAKADRSQSEPEIEEKDIISAADAKKSTSYVESVGYSLKRLVWS